jgi:hypothetical protein
MQINVHDKSQPRLGINKLQPSSPIVAETHFVSLFSLAGGLAVDVL